MKDDLSIILQAIIAADALILAVPTYFLGAHSCLKVFIDRGISFYAIAEKLWGKPAVGVGITGMQGMEESTLLDIERFFSVIHARNHSSRIVYGALPGEVVLDIESRQCAVEIAASLFASPSPKGMMCCPVCKGETGKIGSQMMTNEADALKHRDWLRGMSALFANQRETLKQAVSEYKDEGKWIK